jgi:hypothetical protein
VAALPNKIGFAGYITDNQERDPLYVQQFVTERKAVPGQGFYKVLKKQVTIILMPSGYLTFNAAKYIDFQFGYDKNFIGNGYRSLFLSDFSAPYLFPQTQYKDLEIQLPEPVHGIEYSTATECRPAVSQKIRSHAPPRYGHYKMAECRAF